MTRATLLALHLVPALAAQQAEAPAPSVLETLRAEAAAVQPLVTSDLARAFLKATSALPEVAPRTVSANADRSRWFAAAQAAALPADERAALTDRTLDASFYWNTRYGSPVAYARALDLAAQHGFAAGGAVLDFGAGGLGAPRLLASLGCTVAAVDVDPLLPAFYSEPGDTGTVAAADPASHAGQLALVIGQWPAEAAAAGAVRAALPEGVDLFLSKNTLKHGYVHPAQEVNPRMLVHLGVTDEQFVAEVAKALKPGGLFLIYNLCPAPAPDGQPYIPWADGRCPFARELLEAAGLEVLAFDTVDDEAIRTQGHALGWDQGDSPMDLHSDLFAWFTLARKPAAADPK